jgi:hypothetical protein
MFQRQCGCWQVMICLGGLVSRGCSPKLAALRRLIDLPQIQETRRLSEKIQSVASLNLWLNQTQEGDIS